jgi:hypothetical protein
MGWCVARDGNKRFIGDYSAFESDVLHAQPFFVASPSGGVTIKTNYSSFGSWLP